MNRSRKELLKMPGPKHAIRNIKPKNALKTIKRIISYIKPYRAHLILVIDCVLMSVVSIIAATYFLKPLFNRYIIPFIGQQNPNLSEFIRMILIMGTIYVIGVLATYGYNRLMVAVTTGALYRIRTELFSHMQTLPIRYFDTNTHGELKSR